MTIKVYVVIRACCRFRHYKVGDTSVYLSEIFNLGSYSLRRNVSRDFTHAKQKWILYFFAIIELLVPSVSFLHAQN